LKSQSNKPRNIKTTYNIISDDVADGLYRAQNKFKQKAFSPKSANRKSKKQIQTESAFFKKEKKKTKTAATLLCLEKIPTTGMSP
jgi:hypothetical protein